MASNIQQLRSGTSSKRPDPANLSLGTLAVNYNESDPGIYIRDDQGALVKIAPAFIGATAPNNSPATGGSTGNAVGEIWLNTTTTPPKLQIYSGSAWLDAGGAGAVGAGGNQIFLEVDQTLSASYSITSGKNALTAGPLTVATGQTLTIPSGSNLVIV